MHGYGLSEGLQKESFPFSAVFYIALYPSSKLLVKIMMGDILMQIVQAEN
jgi:hypothetical protein